MKRLGCSTAIMILLSSSASSQVFETEFINRFASRVATNEAPDLTGLIARPNRGWTEYAERSGNFSVTYAERKDFWISISYGTADEKGDSLSELENGRGWLRGHADLESATDAFESWAHEQVEMGAAVDAPNCLQEIRHDGIDRRFGKAIAYLNEDGTMRGLVLLDVKAILVSYLSQDIGNRIQLVASASSGLVKCEAAL